MRMPRLLAGSLSLSAAVVALFSSTAFAQSGAMMSSSDKVDPLKEYSARFGFYNADAREVNRLKTKGFSEATVKGILNLALRTGLDADYIVERLKTSGYSLSKLYAMYNVDTTEVDADIPGFNAPSLAGMFGGSYTDSAPVMSSTTTTTSTTTVASSAVAARGNIIDVAMSDPQLSTFAAAIQAAGLTDTFKGPGPYTVFAPTNAAFASLPAGALDDLLKPENREKLASILQAHVISGRVMASDVMGMSNPSSPTTLGGGTLNVKTTAPIMINNARVVQSDIPATNGVIHLIDAVLMPAGTDSSSSTTAPTTTP